MILILHNHSKQPDIKLSNKTRILEFVRNQGQTTKPEIAKELDISRPTVSALVDELIEEGFLEDAGIGRSTELGGKRPKIIAFRPSGGGIIAVHIGIEMLDMALIDLSAHILFRLQIKNQPGISKEEILRTLMDNTAKLIDKGKAMNLSIMGIGVGSPGVIERSSGTIRIASHFHVLNDTHLGELLKKTFQVPVWVDNECSNLGLAEQWFGIGQASNFVTLMTDIGIGAGIVINDQIMRGADASFGEIGHTTIHFEGPNCRCGNRGCWEMYASSGALIHRVAERLHETTHLKRKVSVKDELTVHLIAEALKQGDRVVEQLAIHELGYYLGIGLVNIVNTFNPELIIIHGAMTELGEPLLARLYREIQTRALPTPASRVEIKFSTLKQDANILGAGALVLKELFDSPAYLFSAER